MAEADLYIANSGTTVRFLTALATLGEGQIRLDGTPRMRERPIGDLLDALGQLGAEVECELGTGCPPVLVHGKRLTGGTGPRGGEYFEPVSERVADGGAVRRVAC